MKRTIEVELFEEHENSKFYTIRFIDEEISESQKFIDRFDLIKKFDKDMDNIAYWMGKIGENGVLERYFRPEKGSLKALPCDTSKLRFFCFAFIEEGICLVGNGGIKETRTYNENEYLNYCADLVESVGAQLKSRLKSSTCSAYSNNLYGNLMFNVNVPDKLVTPNNEEE